MRKATMVVIFTLAMLTLTIPAIGAEPVDNVFITGLDVGYYGATGWIGENFDGGPGFGLFFGYGITEYFSMQLDYMPMIMTSPSGDDVKGMDTAVWGGYSNGGIGAIGISGRLYPRKVYREADFKVVQPYLALGFKYLSARWEWKNSTSDNDDTDDSTVDTLHKTALDNGDEYDGVTNILFDFRFGIDFHITDFVSLGPSLGIHKPFMMGDYIQGETMDRDFKSDWEGSMLWDAALGLKFQW